MDLDRFDLSKFTVGAEVARAALAVCVGQSLNTSCEQAPCGMSTRDPKSQQWCSTAYTSDR